MKKIRKVTVEFEDGKTESYEGEGNLRLYKTIVKIETGKRDSAGNEITRSQPYQFVDLTLKTEGEPSCPGNESREDSLVGANEDVEDSSRTPSNTKL